MKTPENLNRNELGTMKTQGIWTGNELETMKTQGIRTGNELGTMKTQGMWTLAQEIPHPRRPKTVAWMAPFSGMTRGLQIWLLKCPMQGAKLYFLPHTHTSSGSSPKCGSTKRIQKRFRLDGAPPESRELLKRCVERTFCREVLGRSVVKMRCRKKFPRSVFTEGLQTRLEKRCCGDVSTRIGAKMLQWRGNRKWWQEFWKNVSQRGVLKKSCEDMLETFFLLCRRARQVIAVAN